MRAECMIVLEWSGGPEDGAVWIPPFRGGKDREKWEGGGGASARRSPGGGCGSSHWYKWCISAWIFGSTDDVVPTLRTLPVGAKGRALMKVLNQ